MLRKFLLLCLTTFIAAQDFSQPLDLNAYTGKWYQVYGDKFVMSSFEKNAKCISAEYEKLSDNSLSVYNKQINPDESTGSIEGYAYCKDPSFPRQLTVVFNNTGMNGPYWIYELGPIVDNQYQYSIVSDKYKLSLFVLARDFDNFFKYYNSKVLKSLENFGFTKTINSPIKTEGCS